MIKNQEIGFTKGSKFRMECGWLFQLAFYLLGTTTTCKLSMLFQVLGLWLHLKDTETVLFLGLGLTITGNYIKKVQKQENKKNIRIVKRCRDGMPKRIQTR